MRPPAQVMRLERMGASFQTRVSFIRHFIRQTETGKWCFSRVLFDIDDDGYGTAVYRADANFGKNTPSRSYSVVVFTQEIADDQRTDRVIAEVWDATFCLYDGIVSDDDIKRLRSNVPLQEKGRLRSSELVLARANKSLRLFAHIVASLAEGRQPDGDRLAETGYLMRTTAVYGSGKFGIADRAKIAAREELRAPFQAEMLAVYLFRTFTIDLVNHLARAKGGSKSCALHPDYARYLGIGNSTGLGMAPFMVKHPRLINAWVSAREQALARVRSLPEASKEQIAFFHELLDHAGKQIAEWNVEDDVQTARIEILRDEVKDFHHQLPEMLTPDVPQPWDALYRHAEAHYSLEGQEFIAALLLEPHGALIDELSDTMSSTGALTIDPKMPVKQLRGLIDRCYGWVREFDFTEAQNRKLFWYYSEDKIEPRLGARDDEPGAEREMPLDIAYQVRQLQQCLAEFSDEDTTADVLRYHPSCRYIVRRIQSLEDAPYGEIQDNLIHADTKPIDLLRFKLAFFGVSKFDPKSALWTRINLYQGAPLPFETQTVSPMWFFSTRPKVST